MNKSILVAALLAIALSACGKKAEAPAAAPAAPAAATRLKKRPPLRLRLRLNRQSLLLKPLRLLRLLTRSNFSLLTKNGAMPRFFSPQNWGTKKGSRRSLFDNKQELLQLLI